MNPPRKKHSIGLAFLIVLGSQAPPVSAMEANEQLAKDVLHLPSGNIPKQIFGVDCTQLDGDEHFGPSLRCFPTDIMKLPSIGVAVIKTEREWDRPKLIERMRSAYHESELFNVIREEPFQITDDAHEVGVRALYQTNLGNRYVWSIVSEGKIITVTAGVFSKVNFGKMISDIELKVFGLASNLRDDAGEN